MIVYIIVQTGVTKVTVKWEIFSCVIGSAIPGSLFFLWKCVTNCRKHLCMFALCCSLACTGILSDIHVFYWQMLLNLNKKSWVDGLTLQDYRQHCSLNEKTVGDMLDLAKNYHKVSSCHPLKSVLNIF